MRNRASVGRLLIVDVLGSAALAVLWYLYFNRYNRRKGVQALRWVEAACSGEGRIVEARWSSASRLHAHVRIASHWFEHADVTVRLFPRAIPFQWLLCLFRKQKETLTFEADLDTRPSLPLEVFRHRWLTHGRSSTSGGSQEWAISRPGPIMFTTRPQWTHELPPVVHTFMNSRGPNLLSVRFRPESPHLAATIALEALPDRESAASFLSVLRDLAAGAPTLRQ